MNKILLNKKENFKMKLNIIINIIKSSLLSVFLIFAFILFISKQEIGFLVISLICIPIFFPMVKMDIIKFLFYKKAYFSLENEKYCQKKELIASPSVSTNIVYNAFNIKDKKNPDYYLLDEFEGNFIENRIINYKFKDLLKIKKTFKDEIFNQKINVDCEYAKSEVGIFIFKIEFITQI